MASAQGHAKQNRYWDDGVYEPGTLELHATFEDWKLNQTIEPGLFRLIFPKGTRVHDMVRDLRYTKGQIGDPEIKRLVSTARAAAEEPPHEPSGLSEQLERAKDANPFTGGGLSMWLISIAGVVFALAAIVLVLRLGRRRHTPEVGE